MLLKKEFFFIRHGQTDHNISKDPFKGDHLASFPLNETGKAQAKAIEPFIASLPIKKICFSPMQRALETKEIICSQLKAEHHVIEDLKECSSKIWKEMSRLGMYCPLPIEGEVRSFMDRVAQGVNQALSLPGSSPLIVAHGGTHWALCCLMELKNHEWSLPNCGIVHFSVGKEGTWIAKKL